MIATPIVMRVGCGRHCSSLSQPSSNLFTPLVYRELKYNSVEILVDTSLLQDNDSTEFATRLFITIQSLQEKRKTAIYLKVSILLGHLMPLAANYGFKFHHAEGVMSYSIKMTTELYSFSPINQGTSQQCCYGWGKVNVKCHPSLRIMLESAQL